ncbi:hypothetical protein AKJ16_DCAP09806 [Drosera capensis]
MAYQSRSTFSKHILNLLSSVCGHKLNQIHLPHGTLTLNAKRSGYSGSSVQQYPFSLDMKKTSAPSSYQVAHYACAFSTFITPEFSAPNLGGFSHIVSFRFFGALSSSSIFSVFMICGFRTSSCFIAMGVSMLDLSDLGIELDDVSDFTEEGCFKLILRDHSGAISALTGSLYSMLNLQEQGGDPSEPIFGFSQGLVGCRLTGKFMASLFIEASSTFSTCKTYKKELGFMPYEL